MNIDIPLIALILFSMVLVYYFETYSGYKKLKKIKNLFNI